MSSKISIEIFTDHASPSLDPAIGRQGLELINSITNDRFEIIRDTRRVRLGEPDRPTIESSKVDLLRLKKSSPASFAIVLTSRPLSLPDTPQNQSITGYAERFQGLDSGAAVVSTRGGEAQLTLAHEMGHLVGMRYQTESPTLDPDSHCQTETCLMHGTHEVMPGETLRVVKRGIANWLERRGYVPADYSKSPDQRSSTSFCQPCIDQMGRRAFFLAKHLAGDYVPAEWL